MDYITVKQLKELFEKLEGKSEEAVLLMDLVARIDKYMDYGARECPLCWHHYNHDPDCLFTRAKGLLIDWTNTTEECIMSTDGLGYRRLTIRKAQSHGPPGLCWAVPSGGRTYIPGASTGRNCAFRPFGTVSQSSGGFLFRRKDGSRIID